MAHSGRGGRAGAAAAVDRFAAGAPADHGAMKRRATREDAMDDNVAVKTPPISREESIRTGGRGEAKPAPRVPLGEELPLFCEKCGYSLHGMPAVRCDHCTILQFHCPECGHHQPINTLRPAAHRVLGRLRATALGLSVLFKLAFFRLLLFAWAAMPGEWIYRYNNNPPQTFTSGQITINGGTLLVRNGTSTL